MLKGKSFLKLLDFTAEELQYLLDLAKKLREQGFDISDDILTIDDIKLEILKNLKEKQC